LRRWRWIPGAAGNTPFYAPGAVALAAAVYLLWRVRDTPQAVGLPPIEEFRQITRHKRTPAWTSNGNVDFENC